MDVRILVSFSSGKLKVNIVMVLVNQNSVVLVCDRTSTSSYNTFFKAILTF